MQSLAWYDSQTQVDSSQTGDYILIVTRHKWTSALLAPTSDYRRVIELCACVRFVRTAVSRIEQSGVVHLRMRTLSIKSTIPTSEQQEKNTQHLSMGSASSGTLSVVDLWSFEVCRSREVVESLQSLDLMPREGGKKALFISVTWFFSTGLQCHIASLLKIQHMESKPGLVWEAQ